MFVCIYHFVQVSLDIAFLQVNLLVSLDDFFQSLFSLFALLELRKIISNNFN